MGQQGLGLASEQCRAHCGCSAQAGLNGCVDKV